jgi:hypothetical protein
LAENAMRKGSEVTSILTAYQANISTKKLEEKVEKSLNTELRVCYLLERLMSLLDVKYSELEKMRCLLFIAKLFPYKSLKDLLYGNPNKMFYTPNIRKFINFKYSITPYSTFTDEYQIKVSKMKISPSCLIPQYKESLKGSQTSHWSLKIPIRDFVEAGKMDNIGGILYDARHEIGLFPFNYYTNINCGDLVENGAK